MFGFLAKDCGHGFADDVAAAEDHDLGAAGGDAAADEQLMDAGGGTRHKAVGIAEKQFADVQRVKAVDILVGRHGGEDVGFIDLRWQGRLYKDAVQGGVGVEFADELKQIFLGGVFGQDAGLGLDAEAVAGLFLHAHIDAGGGVFPNADKDEARRRAVGL